MGVVEAREPVVGGGAIAQVRRSAEILVAQPLSFDVPSLVSVAASRVQTSVAASRVQTRRVG
jgi:hypothetical protein